MARHLEIAVCEDLDVFGHLLRLRKLNMLVANIPPLLFLVSDHLEVSNDLRIYMYKTMVR